MICDGPATSISMNMVTHSGYYPCRYCLVRGKNYKKIELYLFKFSLFCPLLIGTEKDIKFPSSSFDYSARTRETFDHHSEHGTCIEPYFGVKGPTKISKKVCFSP